MIPCGGYVIAAMKDEEAFERIPCIVAFIFPGRSRRANHSRGVPLFVANEYRKAWLLGSFLIYLPLEQIWQMTMQIGAAIPLLFSQPEHLSGIVGIVAVGGAQVGLSFLKLLPIFRTVECESRRF